MSTATVYRVETRQGEGPYRDLFLSWHEAAVNGGYSRYHVSPEEDNFEGLTQNHRFGFADWEQFMMWFGYPEIVDALEADGFRLTVYEVPEFAVKVGETQVAFDFNYAETRDHYMMKEAYVVGIGKLREMYAPPTFIGR